MLRDLDMRGRIMALLAAREKLDLQKAGTLDLGVGSVAEQAWVLDALVVLLELEHARCEAPLLHRGVY